MKAYITLGTLLKSLFTNLLYFELWEPRSREPAQNQRLRNPRFYHLTYISLFIKLIQYNQKSSNKRIIHFLVYPDSKLLFVLRIKETHPWRSKKLCWRATTFSIWSTIVLIKQIKTVIKLKQCYIFILMISMISGLSYCIEIKLYSNSLKQRNRTGLEW